MSSRGLCGAVIALWAVTLFLPAFPSADAATKDELERRGQELEAELEGARGDIEQIERRKQAGLETLAGAQERRRVLDEELRVLGAELEQAEQALAELEERLARTTERRVATEEELDETRIELEHQRDLFSDRVRATYIHGGGVNYAVLLLDLEDFSEFSRTLQFVNDVVAADRRQMELVATLQRTVETKLEEVAALEADETEQRQVAATERDRVSGLVAQQRDVQRQVAAEEERQVALLAELDADATRQGELVASLEQESGDVASDLERLAAEERRAAEEAERRAAEEAERRAAEEAERRAAEQAERRAREAARTEEARTAAESRASRSAPARSSAPSSSPAPVRGGVACPVGQPRSFSDTYGAPRSGGRAHKGVDILAPLGTPIYAYESGVITRTNSNSLGGISLYLRGDSGNLYYYTHLQGYVGGLRAGQRVSVGQHIARNGDTGNAAGIPHLHWEVFPGGGGNVNPYPYAKAACG